jgi:predicted DNA-binding transcriptional regulator AlpA
MPEVLAVADGDKLIDEHAAAALLGVTRSCMVAWRHRREGPPYCKLVRSVRYRRADLDQWIAANVRRAA